MQLRNFFPLFLGWYKRWGLGKEVLTATCSRHRATRFISTLGSEGFILIWALEYLLGSRSVIFCGQVEISLIVVMIKQA